MKFQLEFHSKFELKFRFSRGGGGGEDNFLKL